MSETLDKYKPPEVPVIPPDYMYVVCHPCNMFVIVPKDIYKGVLKEHLEKFPEHTNVIAGNSQSNLRLDVHYRRKNVALKVFNP